jgi:CSLREA domain-containing protein
MKLKERSPMLFIFGVIFLALALQGCDPSYCASEFIVTKFNDTNDGVCDGDCSLREAVIGSNVCSGTQTIRIPAGLYELSIAGTLEDLAATGDLDVTHDAIIIGEGAPFIDGNGIDRVFEIHSSATVEISTILIRGGEEQVGAGIRNHGSLTMHGGVVANNTGVFPGGIMGGSSGGGIFSDGTLVLENTQIRENSADMGGGVEIVGPGTLDMSGSGAMINGNIAHETGGGLAVGTGAEATLTTVDIWRNEAGYDGGGIFNGGIIHLNQSVVHENTSGSVAGGLVNYYGAETWVTETRFENNEAPQGGAIQTGGLVTLYQSSITNNYATSGAGGGVYVDAAVPGLHLYNTTVSNNTAGGPGLGGGIHNNGGDVWLEWVTVAENERIGIVNTAGGTIAIENSIVAYNTASNCTGIGLGSGGYNIEDGVSCNFTDVSDISSTDPLLGPLTNNGGLTPTHALLTGSPAIDSASPDMCTAIDQRGVTRPQGSQCDRGAYEKDVLVPAIGLTPVTAIPLQMGEVTGRICYPSEFIPPMTLYFEDVGTNLVSQFDHSDGSDHYSVHLFPGTYVAYAYRQGTNIGGSYSQAVLCGLTVNCTDHTLIEFDVLAGQMTMDIDICDYYGDPGDIPAPPGGSPTETPTPPPPLPPISINFNADSYLIKEGKCTTLRWAVENAEDVFLDGELVEVLDARQVCPKKTTKYTLLAMAGEQEEEAFVTIEVEILPEPPEAPARLMFDTVCNTKIYQITLSWLDRADNETGYRVYRDGKLIATLGANATSYVDTPDFGGPYTYAVEAFNEGGASAQVTVQPGACNPVR